MAARRTRAGGAKKRPTRYDAAPTPAGLADALRTHRRGDFASAAALYRAHLAHAPDALDAWMNLGAVYVQLGRAREARAAYATATGLAPGNARAHRDAAIGLAAIGQGDDARAAFERALAVEPSLGGARLGLSRVCAEAGDHDAARYHARAAVALAPDDPSAHLELHRALFDDAALGPCIDAARAAVALDRGYAHARLALAGALAWDGRADEAAAALGDDGCVGPGLRDAVSYAAQHRGPAVRAFAYTRATLEFALDAAARSGAVLEFGVRHAISTRVIAARVAAAVHAFDSFEGLPEAWQGHPPGAFSTAGERPDVPANVTLHVGLFADTLPRFLISTHESPAFVHIDSDLYSSARDVLDALGPRLRPGCVIAFDEYLGNARWRDDEHRALREACARFGWRYEYLAIAWLTGQAVVRLVA